MAKFVLLSLMSILISGFLLAPGCVFSDGNQLSKELTAAIKQLKDDDPRVRTLALEDLQKLSLAGEIPDPGEVLPYVIERFDDEDPLVRAWAYSVALPVAGVNTSSIVLKLDSKEEDVKGIMEEFPGVGVLMPHLVDGLNDESKIVKLVIVNILNDLVPFSREALPGLVEVFVDQRNDAQVDTDPDIPGITTTDLRMSALATLNHLGDIPLTIKPDVFDFLDSEDPGRCSAALEALKHIGPEAGVVDAIIVLLDEGRDAGVMNQALLVLATYGEDAIPAIPAVIKLLDADIQMALGVNVNNAVIYLLGILANYSDDAISPLIGLFDDDDAYTRWNAVTAIKGVDAKPDVLEALLRALDDEDPKVREQAAQALGQYIENSEILIPRLEELAQNDKNEGVRNSAGFAVDRLKGIYKFPTEPIDEVDLEKYKDDPEGLFKELVGRFGEGELLARQYAVNLLAEQFPEEAYPVLINAITDEDPLIRAAVPVALGKIGKGNPRTLPPLLNALDDEDRDVRIAAAKGICLLQEDAIEAVPKLLLMLEDEDEVVRGKVAEALGYAGGISPDEVIPALVGIFVDEEVYPPSQAVISLAAYEESAVPLLIENLENEDERIRYHSLEALQLIVWVITVEQNYPDIAEQAGKFDPSKVYAINFEVMPLKDRAFIEEAIPLIIGFMSDTDGEIRFVAKEIGILAAPEETVAKLIELLGDEIVRCDAISFLRDIEPMPMDAIPVLIGIIESGEFEGEGPESLETHFAEECIFALAEYGIDALDAIEPMIELLSSKHAGIRHAAAWALGEFGPDAASAVDALISALADESPDVRYNTAVTLGKIGRQATSALPKMQEVAADEKNSEVRNALQEAIQKIILAGAGITEEDEQGDAEALLED